MIFYGRHINIDLTSPFTFVNYNFRLFAPLSDENGSPELPAISDDSKFPLKTHPVALSVIVVSVASC